MAEPIIVGEWRVVRTVDARHLPDGRESGDVCGWLQTVIVTSAAAPAAAEVEATLIVPCISGPTGPTAGQAQLKLREGAPTTSVPALSPAAMPIVPASQPAGAAEPKSAELGRAPPPPGGWNGGPGDGRIGNLITPGVLVGVGLAVGGAGGTWFLLRDPKDVFSNREELVPGILAAVGVATGAALLLSGSIVGLGALTVPPSGGPKAQSGAVFHAGGGEPERFVLVPRIEIITPGVVIEDEAGAFRIVAGAAMSTPFWSHDCPASPTYENASLAERLGARRVIVRHPASPSPLRGLLALCPTSPKAFGGLTSTYRIQLPDDRVQAAAAGGVGLVAQPSAVVQPYADGGADIPTWVLWLSQ
ncbi:MAG: hypothetical protein IT176_07430 [Acidobacteria bacterium]|nr:hypothetical protein [Acidobacteriota bacterium]